MTWVLRMDMSLVSRCRKPPNTMRDDELMKISCQLRHF